MTMIMWPCICVNCIFYMYGLDLSLFYRYIRMSPESFKYLLNEVGPIISKADTRFRKAIPSAKQLYWYGIIWHMAVANSLLVFPLGSQNLQSSPLSMRHTNPFRVAWVSSMYGHREKAMTGNALSKFLKTSGIYRIVLVR